MSKPVLSGTPAAGRSALSRTRARRIRRIALSSLAAILYICLSTAGIALYGPFTNIRASIIGAILTSGHPWVIRPFFSAATLQKYAPVAVNAMKNATSPTRDYSSIHDSDMEVVSIQTDRYSGSLLVVNDPKRVHIAVTKELNNVGETVSSMIRDAHAVAGINAGGFYDGLGHGTGGVPIGLTISRGRYICGPTTQVQPIIGITKKGALIVGNYNYAELQHLNIEDAISFGPELVQNGQPFLNANSGSWGIAPRSAIGQRPDGAILLLALSGRGNGGIGASLLDCEQVMLQNGAYIAANLDGGYSSELYEDHHFLVPPSNPLGERYVSTSFIVDGVSGS